MRRETKICAVIVTYFADLSRLQQVLEAVAASVHDIVIVDNGPGLQCDQLSARFPNLICRNLPANRGIASAQNEGIGLAKGLNASHVLFLDHDSVPEAKMVSRLHEALEQLQQGGTKVACVGPEIRSPETREPAPFAKSRAGWGATSQDGSALVDCHFVISSGTLVAMTVIDEVGQMDDGLFIDVVDEEWCLRARGKGYRIFGVRGAVLHHRLGDSARRIWAGRWRRAPRHKPFRYYYIFRNTIAVARRSYVPRQWIFGRLLLLLKLFIAYGVLSGTRGAELRAMLKGIVHGVRGVRGELEH